MKVTNDMSKEQAAVAEMEDPTTAQQQEFALVTRPSMAVGSASSSTFTGDIKPPWLAITHGVGELSKLFSPGELVLDKNDLLYTPPKGAKKGTEPLNIIVWDFKEYWKQYVTPEEFNAGVKAQVFPDEQAAKKAGFTTSWINGVGPGASLAMTWLLLIELPKDITSGLFYISANGKTYAPALMSVDKSAYNAVKDAFGRAAKFTHKARGIKTALWELTTRSYTSKKPPYNEVWVPNLRLKGSLSDEEIKNLTDVVSSGATADADPADE